MARSRSLPQRLTIMSSSTNKKQTTSTGANRGQTSQDPDAMEVQTQTHQTQAQSATSPPATTPITITTTTSERRYTNSAGETIETAEERLEYYMAKPGEEGDIEAGRADVAEQQRKQAERDAQNPR
ncbi:hypothetical protein LTR85_011349 [Meristemomyces frigidus]|nr:hypothetical protein LTR85_011349 [Meristemomyces frigidus]